MRYLFIFFLMFSSTVFASGWRRWGEPQPPSGANYYVAIRMGLSQMNADMQNSIPSFSTSYCQYLDSSDGTNSGNPIGYGPCHAHDGDRVHLDTMRWDDYWPANEQMKENTGFYGVAFGGYLPNHTNVRMELEWTRHNDFDYREDQIYIGYPRDPISGDLSTDLDEDMVASFKSKVASSHILFNFYYDFFEGRRQVGEWTPYIGLGLGLAQNRTQFTLIDPQGELAHSTSPLKNYFKDGIQEVPGREVTHENFAWAARLGLNYALSEHLSFDVGVKYSNLGLIEWGMDENVTLLRSDELVSTDIFFGFRFDF